MTTRRGVTLVDVLVAIATLTILFVTLVQASVGSPTSARGLARDQQCKSQIGSMGYLWSFMGMFNDGKMPTYDWKANVLYETPWFDTSRSFSTDMQAQMAQETVLLRTMTGRGMVGQTALPFQTLTLPHREQNMAPVIAMASSTVPMQAIACPEDGHRLASQQDPFNPSLWAQQPSGSPIESQMNTLLTRQRYPYSSSYWTSVSANIPDVGALWQPTWVSTHVIHVYNNAPHLDRNFAEVAFPSQKVLHFEMADRHRVGQPLFYAYDDAQCNMVF